MSYPEEFSIPRTLAGDTVFIIAGGPSVAGQDLRPLADRPVIAVNLSYSIAPGALYVFAIDSRFLRVHTAQLASRFKGRTVTISRHAAFKGLRYCKRKQPPGLASRPNELVGRRTSLSGAINLAVHAGAGRLAILGADGGYAADGRHHHHAAHPWPVKKDSWPGQLEELQTLKPDLDRLGIPVVNCSPGSHWPELWPIMPLAEFLEREGEFMESLADRYQRAFSEERARNYPAIDAFEKFIGVAMPRDRLESMARELACPVKAHAPNWQHGRLIYALARARLAQLEGPATFLDIGTAKGFSALCFLWAIADANVMGVVHSFDVIDPESRIPRNTVAELDGLKTLQEIIAPHVPAECHGALSCWQHPGIYFAQKIDLPRINGAFVDGKHKTTDVRLEGERIAERQGLGDFILFDDLQLAPVADGVALFRRSKIARCYRFEEIQAFEFRRYMLATRIA